MRAAIYLGSRAGNSPVFCESAAKLGRLLAEKGIGVVYGGARVGTMGALFDGVREGHGKVIGVFPKNFAGRKEYAEKGFKVFQDGEGYAGYDLVETDTFDGRIREMEKLADVCILLPGSYGSMHEFFSFFECNELGRFDKPMAILNVGGYYTPLLNLIKNMQEAGFSDPGDLQSLIVADTPEELAASVKALER